MRSRKNKDRFFVYIVISLVIHLMILFFFPLGSIRGVADGQGDNIKDYGLVRYVDLKAPPETENKPVETEDKQPENTGSKEEEEEEKKQREEEKQEEEKEEKQEVEATVDNETTETPEETTTENKAENTEENSSQTETQEVKENSEVLTSENSKQEIEIEEEKNNENKKSNQEPETETRKESEEESEAEAEEESELEGETESEPTPPSPPKAGELIGLSPKPQYPKYLVGEARTGTVELEVHINQAGEVENINITESSQIDSMDRNAELTIKRGWKFESYKQAYSLSVKVNYSIDKKGNPEVEIELGKPVYK